MIGRAISIGSYLGLILLQIVWHGVLSSSVNRGFVALAFILPLLPGLVLILARYKLAITFAGMIVLFYFVHAVMETMTGIAPLWPARMQAALSIAFIAGIAVHMRLHPKRG
jgi:uncharacterized membrane protein